MASPAADSLPTEEVEFETRVEELIHQSPKSYPMELIRLVVEMLELNAAPHDFGLLRKVLEEKK